MMIKFLLGILIVAFTTFCGYLLGKKYRKRKQFFMEFSLFNERFINEISYYRQPLHDFCLKYAYKSDFDFLLQRFLYCVKERTPLRENLLPLGEFSFLKAEEKNIIVNYFSMLGKGDSVSQKTYFSSMKESLSRLEKGATETCKRYVDLYIKIGFLCGLLILILIL